MPTKEQLQSILNVANLRTSIHLMAFSGIRPQVMGNADAIEIESPEEIRAHPEQVKSNMTKNLKWFSEVEVWCYEYTQDKIQMILDSIDPEYWNNITIMSGS